MFTINHAETVALSSLGQRLEAHRLARNEKQEVFAARLGVSSPTYRKMVKGDPGVKVGYWVQAMNLVGSIDDLELLLAPKKSFFAQLNAEKSGEITQRRVRRKR